jgi:hypothetical protein
VDEQLGERTARSILRVSGLKHPPLITVGAPDNPPLDLATRDPDLVDHVLEVNGWESLVLRAPVEDVK